MSNENEELVPAENVAPKISRVNPKPDLLNLKEILSGLPYIEVSRLAVTAENLEKQHPQVTSKDYLSDVPTSAPAMISPNGAIAILLFIRRVHYALSVAVTEMQVPPFSTLHDVYKNIWPVYLAARPLFSLVVSAPRSCKTPIFADSDLEVIEQQYDALLRFEKIFNIEPEEFTEYSMAEHDRETSPDTFKRPNLIKGAAFIAAKFNAAYREHVSLNDFSALGALASTLYHRVTPKGFRLFIQRAEAFLAAHDFESKETMEDSFIHSNTSLSDLYEVLFLSFFSIETFNAVLFSEMPTVRPRSKTWKFVV